MPTETLTDRLVRGMNHTGTWVPLTQAQADALEFPDPSCRQVYQLPDWWDGDDIPDVAEEVCLLERALAVVCAHADFGATSREEAADSNLTPSL